MSDLTPDALAEIARVTEAATPGPWVMESFGGGNGRWWVGIEETCDQAEATSRPDAEFIAMSRQAIPDLLAALTAKDEEIARLAQALDLTNTALDRALAGRPVRNADEILSANDGLLARIETP